MSEVVRLQVSDKQHDLEVKEFEGKRVVTFKDVDELHQRPEGTARVTFNRHKKRFVEGEDFFVCESYEAEKMGFTAPNGLTLLTESGYLMLVKPFSDDLSWEVQRQLVNIYFRAKNEIGPIEVEDAVIIAMKGLKEIKARQAQQEQQIQRLAVVVDNEVWLTDHQKAEIQGAVKWRIAWLKREGYEATFQALYSALKTHFNVPKYDKIKRKDFDHALAFVKGWYPPRRG